MAFDKAFKALEAAGLSDRVLTFDVNTATVELAAQAVGVEPGMIAKSMTFMGTDGPIMVLLAGDVRVDNGAFKRTFGVKATMLKFEEVERLIGHAVGGVCPFGINEGVKVYLDESLKKYEVVYPACGSDNSAVRLNLDELERASGALGWVFVSK